jgi:hypothetical protein
LFLGLLISGSVEAGMGREQNRRAAIALAQIELNKKPIHLTRDDRLERIRSDRRDLLAQSRRLDRVSITRQTHREDSARCNARTSHHRHAGEHGADVAGNLAAVEAVVTVRRIAIYNADYDLRLMQQSNRAHGLAWSTPISHFCIMEVVCSVSR